MAKDIIFGDLTSISDIILIRDETV